MQSNAQFLSKMISEHATSPTLIATSGFTIISLWSLSISCKLWWNFGRTFNIQTKPTSYNSTICVRFWIFVSNNKITCVCLHLGRKNVPDDRRVLEHSEGNDIIYLNYNTIVGFIDSKRSLNPITVLEFSKLLKFIAKLVIFHCRGDTTKNDQIND